MYVHSVPSYCRLVFQIYSLGKRVNINCALRTSTPSLSEPSKRFPCRRDLCPTRGFTTACMICAPCNSSNEHRERSQYSFLKLATRLVAHVGNSTGLPRRGSITA
ncbi:unnamed protein product, partial [Dicrocoelium dendriticum]